MIRLITYGLKRGAPAEPVAIRYKCTHLPNPHNTPLGRLDGRHQSVRDYVLKDPGAQALVDQAAASASAGQTLAFYCIGGKHRSVAVAEATAARLREAGHTVEVQHHAL